MVEVVVISVLDDKRQRRKQRDNSRIRNAFASDSPAIQAAVRRHLAQWPYVPSPRRYPTRRGSSVGHRRRVRAARVQVGFNVVALRGLGFRAPNWRKTLRLLETLTPPGAEMPLMSALRIVLPEAVDLKLPSPPGKIEVLDSTTLLINRIIAVVESRNHAATVVEKKDNTTVVIRGRRDILAQAADDLIAACEDVRIYHLGHVSATDYETRCLWPVPDHDGKATTPSSVWLRSTDDSRIWVHREAPETIWIDTRYEDIPRPTSWTADGDSSFESYIVTLVRSRIPSHLVTSLYRDPTKPASKLIDVEAFKTRLLLKAFKDPTATPFITPRALKTALSYMIYRGGHRSEANHLFRRAQAKGLPIDTDLFNIMMVGYVDKHDVASFHGLLRQMEKHYQHPDATTWLLFLKLLRRDEEQLLAMSSMFRYGFFDAPSIRRCVAAIRADRDAHEFLKDPATGGSLYDFMNAQASRYGRDWLTTPALNNVLKEAFLFDDNRKYKTAIDINKLLDTTATNSSSETSSSPLKDFPFQTSTFNLILDHQARQRNWVKVLKTLSQMHRHRCVPDDKTYRILVPLAVKSRAPFALGAIFFYASLERKLRRSARKTFLYIFLGRHEDQAFWSVHRPRIFSKPMAKSVMANPVVHANSAVAAAEWAVLRRCHGYRPDQPFHEALAACWRTMDIPLHRIYNGGNPPHRPLRYFSVRLRDPARVRPKMVVHLDAWFSYRDMVHDHARHNKATVPASSSSSASASESPLSDVDDDPSISWSWKAIDPKPLGPFLEQVSGGRPSAEEVYRRIREEDTTTAVTNHQITTAPAATDREIASRHRRRSRGNSNRRPRRVHHFMTGAKLRCWRMRASRPVFWTAEKQDEAIIRSLTDPIGSKSPPPHPTSN
ncbi:hypothetical protein CP532_1593 [Ophiocordyceps camponoti-leonardi (nom. inval.)]|nr:hypothetical protein CP532_1593 [Ophiocordyceps camponoti-leonardi (nom. inval.)]